MKIPRAALCALFSAAMAAAFAPLAPPSAGSARVVARPSSSTFVTANSPRSTSAVLRMADATAEAEAAAEPKKEKFEFQAEVGRVMDLIINSLYSDKDIFLRGELGSTTSRVTQLQWVNCGNCNGAIYDWFENVPRGHVFRMLELRNT